MSVLGSDAVIARAGRLACLCSDYFGPQDRPWRQPGTISLSFGFALSVLAQALVVGVLPLAAQQIGPGAAWTGVPFAAMLLGAVVATFPASHLLDRFGRRAAFALGASLGIAGGLIAAYALLQRDFGALCLGAFWLGIAQGFGLFYRHAAALAPGATPAASAAVLAAGALAGLAGPYIAGLAERLAEPVFLLGTLLAAATVQVAALALAVTIPEPPIALRGAGGPGKASFSVFATSTVIAAAAWFVMIGSMVAVPLAMVGCGIGLGGVSGAIAWHLVAMYAPALFAGRIVSALGAVPTALAGLSLALGGAGWLAQADAVGAFSAAMAMVGAGWALAVSAAAIHLHAKGAPGPAWLAGHDALCLCAALAAALVCGGAVSAALA